MNKTRLIFVMLMLFSLNVVLAQTTKPNTSIQQPPSNTQEMLELRNLTVADFSVSSDKSGLQFCIKAVNNSNTEVRITPSKIKLFDGVDAKEAEVQLFHNCSETAVQANQIVIKTNSLREFQARFEFMKTSVTNGRLEVGNAASAFPTKVKPTVIQWFDFSDGRFFGSTWMFIPIISSLGFFLIVFFIGCVIAALHQQSLTTDVSGKFAYKPDESIVSNVIGVSSILNVVAVLTLFGDKFTPQLLEIVQYKALTIIFGSLALLAGTLLGAFTTRNGQSSKVMLWVYYLNNALIVAGFMGQVILLLYLFAEFQHLGWISAFILLIGLVIILGLIGAVLAYTYSATKHFTPHPPVAGAPVPPPILPTAKRAML